jgi:hypothetical protein
MIRHKATGEFMPELKRGRGYTHWNPGKVDTAYNLDKKLIGTPRLFNSYKHAANSITQWNALPNAYNGFKSGPFGTEEYQINITDDGRKKDDLEIVMINIEILHGLENR